LPAIASDEACLSAHLFLGGGYQRINLDRVILDVVGPFARSVVHRGLATRYFFIRYPLHGAHIRLRLFGDQRDLATRVGQELVEAVGEYSKAELLGVPNSAIANDGEPSPLPSLWWVPYMPETARYGGPCALRFAEQVFHASSELVLDVLPLMNGDEFESRAGFALVAMFALLAPAVRDASEAAALTRYHRERWIQSAAYQASAVDARQRFERAFVSDAERFAGLVHGLWLATTEDSDGLPEVFRAFAHAARSTISKLCALPASADSAENRTAAGVTWVGSLVSDYMHMSNNRFGISPLEEAYLAHLVESVLRGSSSSL
jgi:thiopeptide-type bacteriocin biosynthesis protein